MGLIKGRILCQESPDGYIHNELTYSKQAGVSQHVFCFHLFFFFLHDDLKSRKVIFPMTLKVMFSMQRRRRQERGRRLQNEQVKKQQQTNEQTKMMALRVM